MEISPLILLTDAAFLSLAAITAIDLARSPSWARAAVAGLFALLAVTVFAAFIEHFPAALQAPLAALNTLAFIAVPLLLLVVASAFRRISRSVLLSATVGFAVVGAMMSVDQTIAFVLTLGYITLVGGYSVWELLRGTMVTSGVARWRLRFAAAGGLGFVFVFVLIVPLGWIGGGFDHEDYEAIYMVAAASSIAFFLGFASPRWLRTGWQLAEFRRFLEATSSPDPAERARRSLVLLTSSAEAIIPSTKATLAISKEGKLAPSPSDAALFERYADAIAQAVASHRSTFVRAPDMRGGAVVVPVVSREEPLAILILAVRHAPFFKNDDLSLLDLLAEHTATCMSQAILVGVLEKEIARTERLSSVGAIVASVAHETNNALTYVRANLELIAMDVVDLERELQAREVTASVDLAQVQQGLEASLRGVDGIAKLAATIKATARRDDGRKDVLDLDGVLEGVESLIRLATPANVKVKFERETKGLQVMGNSGELQQVILNLTKNAVEAFAGRKGNVHVRAMLEGGAAELVVIDDGPGIPAALQARLFTSPVTTKKHGTGIGLSIVRRIVADHGGELSVDSTEGRGSAFRVRLPLAAV